MIDELMNEFAKEYNYHGPMDRGGCGEWRWLPYR